MRKLVAVLALLAGWGTQAVADTDYTVRHAAITDVKTVFATVESADTQEARVRNGGTVASLMVDEGDRVSDGQVIAAVGDPKLLLKLQSLEAKAQSLRAERSQAVLDLDRGERLFTQGVVSKARLDALRTALQVIDRGLAAQNAERQVVVQQQKEGAVLAPRAGRVLKVHVTNGTVVMPGESVATIATGGYVLRLELPERHARFIKVGDSVEVGPRGLAPGGTEGVWRRGRIVKVYPQLKAGRVVADAAVDGLGDYFVGERTMVRIGTGTREVILVPEALLSVRFGVTAARVKGLGAVVVQTGERRGDAVEVLSGLSDGDVLLPPAAEGEQRP